MKPNTNLVQHSDHQLRYPQGKKDDVQAVSFHDQCARSIRYLHALSFNYLQGSEGHEEHEAKESRIGFDDQKSADSGFEFASPASTPTRDNVLFCGRIIRPIQRVEQKCNNTKMGELSASTKKFMTYQRSVSNCSSSSGRQCQKTLIGMLSFKAETEMSMSDMKKRQKQRERVSLFPTSTIAGNDELESAIVAGGDWRGDHREKSQVGLLRGMKPKGKLAGVLAKALLLLAL